MKNMFSIAATEMHELATSHKYAMISKAIEKLEQEIKEVAVCGYTCLKTKLNTDDILKKDVPFLEQALREVGFRVHTMSYSTYTHTKIEINW